MIFLNNFCYNVEVAKKFGVNASVFLSCLFGKSISDSNVTKVSSLSREEIYNKTGLTFSTQEKIEEFLSSRKIINVKPFKGNKDKNYYIIYYEEIEKVLEYSLNTKDLFVSNENISRKVVKKETKQEKHINSLKKNVYTLVSSPMLQQMFCDWVDSVYANPKGFLTLPSLKIAYQDLMKFSTDENVEQEVMCIAIKNGYRDIQWAINLYNSSHSNDSSFNWKSYDSMVSDGNDIVNEVF